MKTQEDIQDITAELLGWLADFEWFMWDVLTQMDDDHLDVFLAYTNRMKETSHRNKIRSHIEGMKERHAEEEEV